MRWLGFGGVVAGRLEGTGRGVPITGVPRPLRSMASIKFIDWPHHHDFSMTRVRKQPSGCVTLMNFLVSNTPNLVDRPGACACNLKGLRSDLPGRAPWTISLGRV
jgi:hypothetical protein